MNLKYWSSIPIKAAFLVLMFLLAHRAFSQSDPNPSSSLGQAFQSASIDLIFPNNNPKEIWTSPESISAPGNNAVNFEGSSTKITIPSKLGNRCAINVLDLTSGNMASRSWNQGIATISFGESDFFYVSKVIVKLLNPAPGNATITMSYPGSSQTRAVDSNGNATFSIVPTGNVSLGYHSSNGAEMQDSATVVRSQSARNPQIIVMSQSRSPFIYLGAGILFIALSFFFYRIRLAKNPLAQK